MLNNDPTCELICELAKNDIKIVSGGYGPTFEPKKFLDSGANFVMIGEGEQSIIDLADYFENENVDYKNINGISFLDKDGSIHFTEKQQTISNLDSIPFPQRPYLKQIIDRRSTINMQTSRGCMGACTFCSISAFLSKQRTIRWRGRSIDSIVEELISLQGKGIHTIKFIDDSFIENDRDDKWCEQFYLAVKNNNIDFNFRASIRADKVTENNIKFLHKAGFFSFSCGIENGSKSALKRMSKRASIEDNERALEIFKQNNIYVQGGFILFDDQTTMQELEENYIFLKKYIWLVTKGIFSEMYAAVGTVFTENANLENSNKFASNNIYVVKDIKARKVYEALKQWQIHHSKIYDMVIDPISAPKDIPLAEMKKYYDLMIKMKEIDLLYMREILDCVENNGNTKEVLDKFCFSYNETFNEIHKKAINYYKADSLIYDAEINGFLTLNS